jgi:hypothetical protein
VHLVSVLLTSAAIRASWSAIRLAESIRSIRSPRLEAPKMIDRVSGSSDV